MFNLTPRSMGCKALLLVSLSAITAPLGFSQPQQSEQYRELSGSVHDQQGHPINKAVVQLENENTHALETYIADADGAFHFKRVRTDTDYDVWAAFNGKESKKHALSKFSDKSSVSLRLVIDL